MHAFSRPNKFAKQISQLLGLAILKLFGQPFFLRDGDIVQALLERLAGRSEKNEHAAAVGRIGSAENQAVGHHAVDHLGQRRRLYQSFDGEFAHRQGPCPRENFQHAQLFDWDAGRSQAFLQFLFQLTIYAGDDVSQMVGDFHLWTASI
ncbi:hypothetical protein MES5069_510065 [Mesorhizobium escarrei]|uniref:Uncharacterized protein n=1 Tax=Mesorhizobium escarrei TaxID=666018 RepID=A0ABM9EAF8_9HYPH|nr:hypothetical protein MES5069_510065 [Mesorhizobium escarrei]